MARRLTTVQWVSLAAGVLLAVAFVGLAVCFVALNNLRDARELLVDRLDPATATALELDAALVNEETGVRGFVLEPRETFLQPFVLGRRAEDAALRSLNQVARGDGVRLLADGVRAVRVAADRWRADYAQPALAAARSGAPAPPADVGRERFEDVRRRVGELRAGLDTERAAARVRLDSADRDVRVSVAVVVATLVLAVVAIALALRNVVGRPLARLAEQVRRVSGGAFGEPITPGGARDVTAMGGDVERMRERIVQELRTVEEARSQLVAQAQELERSNAELEQFAYVASHDLQEPLRKVASFCQALERRYGDQLDDRGKQYIDFAVDGAKRMQVLINDLLAFSRVGRSDDPRELVDLGDLVAAARDNLGAAIEESDARIVVEGDLPVVRGDATLLTLVFQNLLGNAIKFRGEAPPEVHVSCRREGDHFALTLADNGIGIAADYADRIFVIFQRLHAKEAYPGTGIGLAMCRKIIEHHGGRIWLESENGDAPGATFRLTLPVPEQETA